MNQTPNILVVGDVMLDRYHHGTVHRISPEAPIPVLDFERVEDRPGGAANVAANAASLGADTTLVTCVGTDEEGQALAELVYLHRVNGLRSIQLKPQSMDSITEVKHRYVAMGQQLLRMDRKGSRPSEGATVQVLETARQHIRTEQALRADVVVLSDYAGGVLDRAQDIIAMAKDLGTPVYVDPKGTSWAKYAGASLIKPNRAELEAMVGVWANPNEMATRIIGLIRKYGIGAMLVTLGSDGMAYISSEGMYDHQPAVSGPVVDVTGAGDTVLAAVAYHRALGTGWPETLRLAAHAAAQVCAQHGTSVAGPYAGGTAPYGLERPVKWGMDVARGSDQSSVRGTRFDPFSPTQPGAL